jgi:hypothetical protein
VRARIGDGTAARSAGEVARLLRQAGTLLQRSAHEAVDAAAWQREVAEVDALGTGTPPRHDTTAPTPVSTAEVLPDDRFDNLLPADAIVPDEDHEATLPDHLDEAADAIVPIEDLLSQGAGLEVAEARVVELEVPAVAAPVDDDPVVDIALLAPDSAPAPWRGDAPTPFEASLATYADLLHDLGVVAAPLEELVTAPAPGPERLPDPEPVVAVESLFYRGPAALRRAAVIQAEMRTQLSRGQHIAVLRPLLDELLDLVPLALDGA